MELFWINLTILVISYNSHWREAKTSNQEEKEKFDILFSNLDTLLVLTIILCRYFNTFLSFCS